MEANKAKIKILFFIFDLGGGGAEKVLVNLVNNLPKEKYEITIGTIFGGGQNAMRLNPNIKYKPFFKCIPFGGITKFFKIFSPSFLHKILIKEKYDYEIAFLQHTPTRIIGGGRKQEYNIKRFAFIHTVVKSKNQFISSYKSEKELSKIYNSYDKLAFVSEEALQSFSSMYDVATPKYVVHNVNEFEKIKILSTENMKLKLNREKINIISIGRLAPEKGFIRLIESCVFLINNNIENWHLYILGEGNLRNELEKMITDKNLTQNISLLGYHPNPYNYLSKMDFYVCSSFDEGYSTAATEAIYLGIPIITTDCGGMHDIIGNTNAGLIVENSQVGLNEGLYRLLNEPELLPLLKEGAKKRSKDFSTSAGIKEFEDFINN